MCTNKYQTAWFEMCAVVLCPIHCRAELTGEAGTYLYMSPEMIR